MVYQLSCAVTVSNEYVMQTFMQVDYRQVAAGQPHEQHWHRNILKRPWTHPITISTTWPCEVVAFSTLPSNGWLVAHHIPTFT